MSMNYFYLEHGDIQVQVKFDDEGMVIDLFKKGEILDSTWVLYSELPVALKGE